MNVFILHLKRFVHFDCMFVTCTDRRMHISQYTSTFATKLLIMRRELFAGLDALEALFWVTDQLVHKLSASILSTNNLLSDWYLLYQISKIGYLWSVEGELPSRRVEASVKWGAAYKRICFEGAIFEVTFHAWKVKYFFHFWQK